ncbi:MAG TPA: hypothetical protein PKX81_06935, partial [Gemmiger formicilis]|nr:hypothetical protein [Gemmiger formicilis]
TDLDRPLLGLIADRRRAGQRTPGTRLQRRRRPLGLGAFAASVGPLSAPEPSPTPIVTATPETAATPTPSPTPSPTPEPDKPLTMEASVIQQDVGVTLYVENAPEPSPTP